MIMLILMINLDVNDNVNVDVNDNVNFHILIYLIQEIWMFLTLT